MFSREEASKIRHEFWTTFGLYMAPVLSAEGNNINWINYKTGVKPVNLKTETERKAAFIRLEVAHKDADIAEIYYEQLKELKLYFSTIAGEDWEWVENPDPADHIYGYVEKRLEKVSVFNKDSWPNLIEFFKKNLILIDEFWSDARFTFLALQ